jgi:hypothetical protein
MCRDRAAALWAGLTGRCVCRAGASMAAGKAGQRASAAGGVESMISVITLMVDGGGVEL